jgi:hypothetical protein
VVRESVIKVSIAALLVVIELAQLHLRTRFQQHLRDRWLLVAVLTLMLPGA